MATWKSFEDIDAWQEARILCNQIYKMTKTDSFQHEFRFKEQIKSASGSIMDNIAEGFERNGNAEFRQFLSIAKGSAGEVRSQLYRALDAQLINQHSFDKLLNLVLSISSKINKIISYLNQSNRKGYKYESRSNT